MVIALLLVLSACSVYIVPKEQLANHLQSESEVRNNAHFIRQMKRGRHNNQLDTVVCLDKDGVAYMRRLKYDSKFTVVLNNSHEVTFFAKSLFVWKSEFLIGERSRPSLVGSGYQSVRIADISRIELRGL